MFPADDVSDISVVKCGDISMADFFMMYSTALQASSRRHLSGEWCCAGDMPSVLFSSSTSSVI